MCIGITIEIFECTYFDCWKVHLKWLQNINKKNIIKPLGFESSLSDFSFAI